MKTIPELQKQIDAYRKLLAEVSKPYPSSQDGTLERMLSGMLCDAAKELKFMEQRTVKLHGVDELAYNSRPVSGAGKGYRRNGIAS